jgi:hypothetical protein
MESNIKNILDSDVDILVRQFIVEDQPDTKELRKKYIDWQDNKEVSFGYQFATACGEYAVKLITENGNPDRHLEEGIKRFSYGVLLLNDKEFAFALEHLKSKLSSEVSEFTHQTKDGRELTGPIRKRIAYQVNKNLNCSEGKRDILIKVITDYDKMEDSISSSKRVGLGRS